MDGKKHRTLDKLLIPVRDTTLGEMLRCSVSKIRFQVNKITFVFRN